MVYEAEGITALMRAGNAETLNTLIEAGADDLTDNEGKTALIHAAESKYSDPETVNALIDAGSLRAVFFTQIEFQSHIKCLSSVQN